MVYTRNQPIATDDLSVSQVYLQQNTNGADDVFGVDHYMFSNTTGQAGLHNSVTTPAYNNVATPGQPPTTTTTPILYGFAYTTATGLIQHSRGPQFTDASSAIYEPSASPLTVLQSKPTAISISAGGNYNFLSFVGINLAICTGYLYSQSLNIVQSQDIAFNGTTLFVGAASSTSLVFQASTTTLQIHSVSNVTDVYWSLRFHRIQ